MPDDEKREQESRPLRKISDNFRKIIVTYDDISPYHNEDGFLNIGLAEFLRNDNSLDLWCVYSNIAKVKQKMIPKRYLRYYHIE